MAGKSAAGYSKGVAFVVEGPTERVFYHEYLRWCCKMNDGSTMIQLPNRDYVISSGNDKILVKFNVKGSVGSVPNATSWIRSTCMAKPDITWTVVLCYDTDGDASLNLNTRAWQRFRNDLADMKLPVIDLAADADIEDVMLLDIEGVRRFLKLASDVEPQGRKGKAKLNSLFKAVNVIRPYHAGEKARPLVQSLDFNVIERDAPIAIRSIRAAIFGAD